MWCMTMTDIYLYAKENGCLSTLKETSKDKHDKKSFYMTNSNMCVVDFDKVKECYTKPLDLKNIPASVDAIVVKPDALTFIEFKNGKLDNKEIHKIQKKIYDSILIFSDITGSTISKTRKNTDFILVYNYEKNPQPTNQAKNKYCESQSRDDITNYFLGLGGEHQIKYDMEMFQGYCFRNVYTYTEKEFYDNFVNKCI